MTPTSRFASATLCPTPEHVRSRTLFRLCAVLFVMACSLSWGSVKAQDVVHTVARGEHLSEIARRYGVSVSAIVEYNEISNPSLIVTGQELLIPGRGSVAAETYGQPADPEVLPDGNGYYTVRQGDTLSEIAKSNGMAIADLMRLNGLTNARFVWVGQQLRLSARVEPSGSASDQTERSDIAYTIHVVRAGDTLSEIAQQYNVSMQDLLSANGLPSASFIWIGQRLRVKANSAVTETVAATGAPVDGTRWIEVDLSDQTLTAWQGDVAIMYTSISSGLPGTPTITGRFQIGTKYQSARMTGQGYDLPGVPWVMYFYGEYGIHGAYWHNNFGAPMSHGCVNMRVGEAQFLYNWAPIGTVVEVHE